MGWIGAQGQAMHFLRTMNADRDEEGRFLIAGKPPTTFLGMDGDNTDMVIPDETVYRKDGVWWGLASGLAGTSYGMQVKVFG